jgi:hypothetical protein
MGNDSSPASESDSEQRRTDSECRARQPSGHVHPIDSLPKKLLRMGRKTAHSDSVGSWPFWSIDNLYNSIRRAAAARMAGELMNYDPNLSFAGPAA